MTYLIATGLNMEDRTEWLINKSKVMLLGRSADNDCAIPWDSKISRTHAEFKIDGEQITLRCFSNIRNQLFYEDHYYNELSLSIGNQFKIGDTLFQFSDTILDSGMLNLLEDISPDEGVVTEFSLKVADVRIALVTKNVPQLWLSRSSSELSSNTVPILTEILPHADLVAIVNKDITGTLKVLNWERPDKNQLQLSINQSLVHESFDRKENGILVENNQEGEPVANGRWAFCIPVNTRDNNKWCLYASGRFGENSPSPAYFTTLDLKDDINIVDLLAQLLSAVRQVKSLESRFSGIQQFFSPSVMNIISDTNTELSLKPKETYTAILYCDLRGFSRMAEQASGNLQKFLDHINKALGVMTQSISRENGAIADFQGDSALGFWGWPVPLSEGAIPACKAALRIDRLFQQAKNMRNSDLKDFQVGIGLTGGKAIAGKIGTKEQSKLGVFGPVVNLSARLEGLTKQIGTPILMDETTARDVRNLLPKSVGRCRRIGTFIPAGFEFPIRVSQLLQPESISNISDQNIVDFELAVEAFESGLWDDALEHLGTLPVKDRAKDYLLMQIAKHNYEPPADWDGVIALSQK